MPSTIQPFSPFIGMVKAAIECSADKSNIEITKTNTAITKSLGDVERCVVGYSSREGFFGKLGGIVYRMWNAVKAVFGQSDWQKCRRAITSIEDKFLEHPFSKKIIKVLIENKDTLTQLEKMGVPIDGLSQLQEMEIAHIDLLIQAYKVARAANKTTEKELDKIIKKNIEFNENKIAKNIVNHPEVQKIIGDGKPIVNIVVKLFDVFKDQMPAIVGLVQDGMDGKEKVVMGGVLNLLSKSLNDVAKIEGLNHLAAPLYDIFPEVMTFLIGGEKEQALGLVFSKVPAIKELFMLFMASVPENKKLGKSF
jgi:hypothetical protein